MDRIHKDLVYLLTVTPSEKWAVKYYKSYRDYAEKKDPEEIDVTNYF